MKRRSAKAAKTDEKATKPASQPAGKKTGGYAFTPPRGAKRKAQPDFLPPMLPTLAAAPPSGTQWIHELKFDGYRIEAVAKAGRVRLRTRTGLDWTDRFPTIAVAIAALAGREFIIDGEVVVEEQNGVSDFSALQNALSEGDASGMVYYAFDLIAIDGYDLTSLSVMERKEALAALLMTAPKDTILRLE